MSAPSPIDRLNSIFTNPSAAASLEPETIYKIIEAAILYRLGDAARTIAASKLHAFVRELAFNWVDRPDCVDVSEWFEARDTLSDADLGVVAYVQLHNPSTVTSLSADQVSTSSYSPTRSQLSPPDDFDEEHLERLGFSADQIANLHWA
jgi:hypothetical protein